MPKSSLCTPGLLHYRCSARCCLRPRGLVSHFPLTCTYAWLARLYKRSAGTQTSTFSGLCVRFRAFTLHLAKLPLPRQRFRAAGSTLPGKASFMHSFAYPPSQQWLRAWLTYSSPLAAPPESGSAGFMSKTRRRSATGSPRTLPPVTISSPSNHQHRPRNPSCTEVADLW